MSEFRRIIVRERNKLKSILYYYVEGKKIVKDLAKIHIYSNKYTKKERKNIRILSEKVYTSIN